jgi:hypothetical protein
MKTARQYYAVCNVGGPISISIMAIDDNDAAAQFESMNAREAIDDCKCDAEDDLDINGQSMDEDAFEAALMDAGLEFARDLDPVASGHDGRAMSVVGGWKLYRRAGA